MPIVTYNVTGIAEGIAALGEKRLGHPNVTLVFINDLNGIVSLKDAYMKMRFQYQEEVEVEKPKNVIKKEGEVDKKNDTENASTEPTTEEKTEEPPAKETVLVTKRKVRKVNLHISLIPDRLIILPMSEEERRNSTLL